MVKKITLLNPEEQTALELWRQLQKDKDVLQHADALRKSFAGKNKKARTFVLKALLGAAKDKQDLTPALGILTAALKDKEIKVQQLAILTLHFFERKFLFQKTEQAEKILPMALLVPFLQNLHTTLRTEAVQFFGFAPWPKNLKKQIFSSLLSLLQDKDSTIRWFAAHAFVNAGKQKISVAPVLPMLKQILAGEFNKYALDAFLDLVSVLVEQGVKIDTLIPELESHVKHKTKIIRDKVSSLLNP